MDIIELANTITKVNRIAATRTVLMLAEEYVDTLDDSQIFDHMMNEYNLNGSADTAEYAVILVKHSLQRVFEQLIDGDIDVMVGFDFEAGDL